MGDNHDTETPDSAKSLLMSFAKYFDSAGRFQTKNISLVLRFIAIIILRSLS